VNLTQKQKFRGFLWLRIKKYLVYQTPLVLLFAVLFVLISSAKAEQEKIIINEILIDGLGGEEFVELYNPTSEDIPLKNWYFNYYSSGRLWENPYRSKEFPQDAVIKADSFYLIGFVGFGAGKSNWQPYATAQLSNSNGSVAIFRDNSFSSEEKIDAVGWGTVAGVKEKNEIKVFENGKSFGRSDYKDSDDNVVDFVLQEPTPWEGNKKDETEDEDEDEENDLPKNYSDKIIINEIFPAPLKDSGLVEFVELYSSSDKMENLDGWYLKDRSGKICLLTGKIIDPVVSRFLILKNNADEKCTLALNDTQGESLELFNPIDKEPVFKVSYEGSAKKGLAYAFNGSRWRWTKFFTPNSANIFNNEPYGKLKIDEDIFASVYGDFSISTGDLDGDKVKVTWDFGDGHKSYLAKTRHKYEKVGTYIGSVKLSDGSEDVVNNFTVEVKEFPHPKIKIIAINANPEGADTGIETLTIENKSKKKINLNGWSIATGWKEKYINHPIREDFVIAKNKTKEITSKLSSFYLNNTKAKIQLRYPDGKVAHEVKYKSPSKAIADGEVYRKVEGGWAWQKNLQLTTDNKQQEKGKIQDANNSSLVIESLVTENAEMKKVEEVIVPVEIFDNKLVSMGNENIKIELLKSEPQVLGAETVREIDGSYFFTPQTPEQEYYLTVFLKNISSSLNLKLNILLNYFFK